jgi:hypothetical protein
MAGASTDQYFSFPTIDAVRDHVMRRVQVLYAGAIAQTLEGNKIDPKAINNLFDGPAPNNTAAHDFAKIKELLRLWIAMRYPTASAAYFEKQLAKAVRVLSNSAAKLVIQEALVIHALTAAVMQAYTSFNKLHKNKKFEFTKGQVDSLPAIQKRFP